MATKQLLSVSFLCKDVLLHQGGKISLRRGCSLYPNSCIHTSIPALQETTTSKTTKLKENSAQKVKSGIPPSLAKSEYNDLIDSAKRNTSLEKREQFSLVLNEFLAREKYHKGHVGFIRLAMVRMDEFGLKKDLTTYNRILDIFPKGRFAPKRMLDAFWPRPLPQLELALELLTKMEDNGIKPNFDTYDILTAVFGKSSFPMEKCIRMMYLFDIYKDVDPYWIEGDMPTNPFKLSKLTLDRITGKEGEIVEHKVCSSDEDVSSYVISGRTKQQQDLLYALKDAQDILLYVEGPHRLWLCNVQQFYFTLRLSREQIEDPVLGVCMCQPANQESLMEWMEALQETYPSLTKARIVYNIRTVDEEIERRQLLVDECELTS